MMKRIMFGAAGVVIWALVTSVVLAGWRPSHGQRITRKDHPVAFGSVMSVSGAMGIFFFLLLLLLLLLLLAAALEIGRICR
jgi:hypothetical protein